MQVKEMLEYIVKVGVADYLLTDYPFMRNLLGEELVCGKCGKPISKNSGRFINDQRWCGYNTPTCGVVEARPAYLYHMLEAIKLESQEDRVKYVYEVVKLNEGRGKNRQQDGNSCIGCGLPNYQGLCPHCRGAQQAYEKEFGPLFPTSRNDNPCDNCPPECDECYDKETTP
jgi:hypothetical protein